MILFRRFTRMAGLNVLKLMNDTTATESSDSYDRPLGCTYWPNGPNGQFGLLYMQTRGRTVCTSQINCICKPADEKVRQPFAHNLFMTTCLVMAFVGPAMVLFWYMMCSSEERRGRESVIFNFNRVFMGRRR